MKNGELETNNCYNSRQKQTVIKKVASTFHYKTEFRKAYNVKTESIDGFTKKYLHILIFLPNFFLMHKPLGQFLQFIHCGSHFDTAQKSRLQVINGNVETIT